jgi:hypothetical protein
MDDFAVQLLDMLGVNSASAQLAELLCMALDPSSQDSSSAAGEFFCKAGDLADACFLTPSRRSFTTAIEMYGQEKIRKPGIDLGKMPMLIIDDFNEATEKNTTFVKKLLQSAATRGVLVFILTEKRDWATTLVRLNGGRKIKPLYGNVDNADYTPTGDFAGNPMWNSLPWRVETLRELILPGCTERGVDPANVVPDNANMTPAEAKRKLQFLLAQR